MFERIILLDPVLFSAEILLFQRLAPQNRSVETQGTGQSGSGPAVRFGPDADNLRQDLQRNRCTITGMLQHSKVLFQGAARPTPEGLELACNPAWETDHLPVLIREGA